MRSVERRFGHRCSSEAHVLMAVPESLSDRSSGMVTSPRGRPLTRGAPSSLRTERRHLFLLDVLLVQPSPYPHLVRMFGVAVHLVPDGYRSLFAVDGLPAALLGEAVRAGCDPCGVAAASLQAGQS